MPFLTSLVPEEFRSHIHSISIQEIISTYQDYGKFSWLADFKEKYALN